MLRLYLTTTLQRYNTKLKELTDEPVAFLDVYNEFNSEVAPKFRIKNYKSRVCMLSDFYFIVELMKDVGVSLLGKIFLKHSEQKFAFKTTLRSK